MTTFSIFNHKVLSLLEDNKSSTDAFIYTVNMDKFANHLPLYLESLSTSERQKATKYYTRLLSERYIISHGLLRYILSYHIKQTPKDIEFTYNKYGKPTVKGNRVKFNMSHSNNIVCYIVAWDKEVGIDVEYNKRKLDISEFLYQVSSPQEVILFNALKADAQHKTFYNLWTRKEAIVKAIGEGLYYPINTIDILNIKSGEKVILNNRNNNINELYTYILKFNQDYTLSIASEINIDKIIYLKTYKESMQFNKLKIKLL